MKKAVINILKGVLMGLLLFGFLAAQPSPFQQKQDSLTKVWKNTSMDDTSRMNALMYYAWNISGRYPDSTLKLAEKLANKAGENPGYRYWQAKALELKGTSYRRKRNFDRSLKLYEEAYAIYESLNDQNNLTNTLNLIGSGYLEQELYGAALEVYFKALSLSEAKSTKTVGDLYHNIGMIYFNQKLHDSALVYANRALAVREASGYEVGKGMSYMNIGNVYQDLGNHEQALTYFQKTLDIYSKTENDLWAANVYGNMGNTFRDSGDYEEAIKAYREAEKRFVEIGNKASLSRLNWAIGNTYYLWKKPDKAEPFCLKADKLALQIKSKENQLLACDCLYGVYKDLGQLAEAMKYGERFVLLQDSIRLQSIANRLANQETKYAYEKELLADSLAYVQQAAALQNEVREQQTQRNIVIGALLAGAIILLLVWRSYRQNKRANEELEKKNQTIRLALEERETLLKEIHHRVKNNLQVVSSLLSLQSRGLQNDEAQQALQEGQNRVRAMALIHQNLYQEGNLVGVDVPAYVGKLVQTLVQSYKIDTQQVEIDLDISPITLDVDTLIPLGLIINELVTNALKYAFKEGQQGKLVVGIGQTSEALILSVKDNGPGLPEGFDMKQGSSMGFRLVQAFSRKMKATVEVKNEGGALIELTIPHPKSLKA